MIVTWRDEKSFAVIDICVIMINCCNGVSCVIFQHALLKLLSYHWLDFRFIHQTFAQTKVCGCLRWLTNSFLLSLCIVFYAIFLLENKMQSDKNEQISSCSSW